MAAQFTSKRGEAGWPNPQARQIQGWCKRYGVTADLHRALTGTIYLTLTVPNGESIKVRCADHADAYATADFTVDPAIDQRAEVKAWVIEHGDDTASKGRTADAQEYARLRKSLPLRPSFNGTLRPVLLMADGREWYAVPEKYEGDRVTLERMREQAGRTHNSLRAEGE